MPDQHLGRSDRQGSPDQRHRRGDDRLDSPAAARHRPRGPAGQGRQAGHHPQHRWADLLDGGDGAAAGGLTAVLSVAGFELRPASALF